MRVDLQGPRSASRTDGLSSKDATPPPVKKPKYPPIKKNKPSAAPVLPPKPLTKPAVTAKPDSSLTVPGARKPAATANNADFDLRDANVYASLFAKPSGSTPNAGLNRKEREEERRKELNKMRDEARAKRMQDMVSLSVRAWWRSEHTIFAEGNIRPPSISRKGPTFCRQAHQAQVCCHVSKHARRCV
ncbi:hypothetical protein BDW22DRAFT_1358709 [Trametopsis cervina]|nr:hypothetical protein BDW22DRAFT_1358709 [Trametopsis cervina]